MSIEQKQPRPDVNPEYPYTINDVMTLTGIPNTSQRKGQLGRVIDKIALTPFTDPKGRVMLSEADLQRVVNALNERKKSTSKRGDLESANLPDDQRITARNTLHLQQITEIVTIAREEHQPFSLEQIINVLDPTPKRSDQSKADARKKARNAIFQFHNKIKLCGWTIDPVTERKGQKNLQYWFRRENEPPFTPLLDTKTSARKEITLPNGTLLQIKNFGKVAKVIEEALNAQRNKTPYTEQELNHHNEHGQSSFTNDWIKFIVRLINEQLKPSGYKFTSYEIEIEGKKTRAFGVTGIKQRKPTSFPERKSLKDSVPS